MTVTKLTPKQLRNRIRKLAANMSSMTSPT